MFPMARLGHRLRHVMRRRARGDVLLELPIHGRGVRAARILIEESSMTRSTPSNANAA
jgi:hypothetical protein